jgi:hypothetical protein
MNRNTVYPRDWVEVLESREMFSASFDSLVLDSSAALAPAVVMPRVAEAKVKTPNIVGAYTGAVSDTNESAAGVITTVIKTQNAQGKITGYVESVYPGQATHTTSFTGTIIGDAFIMKTATTTVTGTVSSSGSGLVLTGSYSFNGSNDSSIGRFVVTRHRVK